jgi:Escherichia/Staphylococcus phage prohead protease
MTVLTRAYAAALELRDDGRTLVGIAVPYGVETRIGRYVESFAPGAFADADTHTLTAAHPRDGAELPIGRSVELRDQVDGLHGAWHVSDTETGNAVLTLVRDGVPLGLSIGFIPGRETWNRDRTRVTRPTASLDHVAVVRQPAYPDAKIAALRPHSRYQRHSCTWHDSEHDHDHAAPLLPRLRNYHPSRQPLRTMPSPGQLRPRPTQGHTPSTRLRRPLGAPVPRRHQTPPVVH